MAKRVYTLAKEIGVNSKAIVAKCQAEGLADTVKNHMSTLSAGLEATIREWFSEAHEAGTAVELGEKVDVAAAKRRAQKKRKKRKSKDEQVPPAEAQMAAVLETPVEQAQPQQPSEQPVVTAQQESATAEEALTEPQVKPPEDTVQTEPPPLPKITPSPKHIPEPAKLQGPTVVRVEEPERVSPIRPSSRGPRPGKSREPILPTAGAEPKSDGPVRAKGRRGGPGTGTTEDKTKRLLRRRRRGFDAGEKIKEWRDRDLIERSERLAHASGQLLRGRQTEIREGVSQGTLPRSGKVSIKEPIMVKDLSAAMGVKASEIISKLMNQGVMASLNDTIQTDVAELLALDYGVELNIEREEGMLELFVKSYEALEPVDIRPRAPVVTLLGHVDHGKTSLLDRIRSSHVVDGEAGGITQHIGAHRVSLGKNRDVVFLDTPGHEAFTAMRARGANMTDIVVLVVAADDGVMPQTEEAINHAKAAGVPVVVALNKIDLPGIDMNRILGQLAEKGLSPHEWGGDTEVVQTSATTGQGVDDLLEHLIYIAELEDLKTDAGVPASGTVIESELDPGRGVVARLLVQRGTLKVGDIIAAGIAFGRVRAIMDESGRQIDAAVPSTPVEVMGLNVVPVAGERFYVTEDMAQAKALAQEGERLSRQVSLGRRTQITLDNFMGQIDAGKVQELCVILRADVQGSVDVLCQSLNDLSVSEIKVRILQAMVGGITEGDVLLAQASGAVIIGFNVVASERARSLAENSGVEIRSYRVIYEVMDELRAALERRLAPKIEEKVVGRARVRQIFKISRLGTVAGCLVNEGLIRRTNKVRLIRDDVVINEGLSLESLKRVKDDSREVKSGLECGIKLAGFDDIKVDDIIEAYEQVETARTLSSVAAEDAGAEN
ncbi:MAG: translation initiation factor IF-2 [Actinobacteria bacterium]|nr:translation initiation factor IF-2 [Actinomycetota bacterium]